MPEIELPWPPKELSPNASGQGKWRRKSEAAKKYKNECALLLIAQGVRQLDASSVHVTIIFQPPSLRRYDLDNALARCKQGLDAVAERIGVDDADWLSLTLSRGDKVAGGRVIVSVATA
jgi:crossover junction endodeoxyribonuclease RusA